MKTLFPLKIFLFFFLFLVINGIGCKKDGEIFQAKISSSVGPKEGSKNQKNKFTVNWGSPDSCGETDHFSDKKNGNVIEIKTYGFRKNGVGCLDMPTQKTGDYYFKTSREGTYILKFINLDESFIADTIVIK